MAETHTSDTTSPNFHAQAPINHRSSSIPTQGRQSARDNVSQSPPRPVGIRRTWSFSRVPSTLPNSHSMFIGDDDGGVGPAEDDLIDEVSPSEDDRFAESIVRGDSKS